MRDAHGLVVTIVTVLSGLDYVEPCEAAARGERMTNPKLSTLGWLAVSVGAWRLRPHRHLGLAAPVIVARVPCGAFRTGVQQPRPHDRAIPDAAFDRVAAACWCFGRAAEAHCEERSFAGGGRRNRRSAAVLMLGVPWVAMDSTANILANGVLAGTAFVLFRILTF